MENNVDLSMQKTINELIKRATEERNKAIKTIDFLLTHKLPFVFSTVQNMIDSLTQISERLKLEFESEEGIDELKNSCIETLNTLKEQLESVELTETELLSSDVIGNSVGMIEEISNKLDTIPGRILEKSKNNILQAINKKESQDIENKAIEAVKIKIKEQKTELEKKEMYLRGMLEVTILPKKKRELEEQISELADEIQKLDNRLINIDSFGKNRNGNIKSNEEKQENEKRVEETEIREEVL